MLKLEDTICSECGSSNGVVAYPFGDGSYDWAQFRCACGNAWESDKWAATKESEFIVDSRITCEFSGEIPFPS